MTAKSSTILAPFAALYGIVTKTRVALYQRGILKSSKLATPVLSVGNITAGGTGKTPLVEHLARIVAANGCKVCILTRGYGREHPIQRVLVSDGTDVLATEREAGDEPLLLAQNLRGLAAVISDANRIAAGKWAIENLGTEVFVLDDGFQHLQLARNLNIATIDASNPWGNGRLLPRGFLREPVTGLRRADCLVITRANQTENLDELRDELRSINNTAPLFTSRMRTRALFRLGATEPIEKLTSPLAAFCAVGNHESFVRQAAAEELKIVKTVVFGDHHRYTQNDIDKIIDEAKSAGAEALLTTAKDAVKLKELSIPISCYVLDIEIEIDSTDKFGDLVRAAIS
jgi:tetraacyldisaccharide 4'-kinase